MQKFYVKQTPTTPEINLSPDENLFVIRGTSSPEDVRSLYYPVTEWTKVFVDNVIEGVIKVFNNNTPVKFQVDLSYFNSSSAKFLYDIFYELKRLPAAGIPVNVEWFYDEEDSDMEDAGSDIALLVGMEFSYISKPKSY
jgi:hypothetical protein